jgi:hypothetical protein
MRLTMAACQPMRIRGALLVRLELDSHGPLIIEGFFGWGVRPVVPTTK